MIVVYLMHAQHFDFEPFEMRYVFVIYLQKLWIFGKEIELLVFEQVNR